MTNVVRNPFCTCSPSASIHAAECLTRRPQIYNAGRIMVTGSREWTDAEAIEKALVGMWLDRPQTVIHGAARGADQLADGIACDLGYRVQAYPANWDLHGRAAGVIRNLHMLKTHPDCVLAFQLNNSRGTQHAINAARKHGVMLKVCGVAEQLELAVA